MIEPRWGNSPDQGYWIVQDGPGGIQETNWLLVDWENAITVGSIRGIDRASACRDALNGVAQDEEPRPLRTALIQARSRFSAIMAAPEAQDGTAGHDAVAGYRICTEALGASDG